VNPIAKITHVGERKPNAPECPERHELRQVFLQRGKAIVNPSTQRRLRLIKLDSHQKTPSRKSFGKHGALHNPFAYGYIDHVPHANFQGGHVTVCGMVYAGETLPAKYRGRFVAADLLGHGVWWNDMASPGYSFSSANGEPLLTANDR